MLEERRRWEEGGEVLQERRCCHRRRCGGVEGRAGHSTHRMRREVTCRRWMALAGASRDKGGCGVDVWWEAMDGDGDFQELCTPAATFQ